MALKCFRRNHRYTDFLLFFKTVREDIQKTSFGRPNKREGGGLTPWTTKKTQLFSYSKIVRNKRVKYEPLKGRGGGELTGPKWFDQKWAFKVPYRVFQNIICTLYSLFQKTIPKSGLQMH